MVINEYRFESIIEQVISFCKQYDIDIHCEKNYGYYIFKFRLDNNGISIIISEQSISHGEIECARAMLYQTIINLCHEVLNKRSQRNER